MKVIGAVRPNRTFEPPELPGLVASFEKKLAVSDEDFAGPSRRPRAWMGLATMSEHAERVRAGCQSRSPWISARLGSDP